MHDWRMSLRRMKSAIISWAGSIISVGNTCRTTCGSTNRKRESWRGRRETSLKIREQSDKHSGTLKMVGYHSLWTSCMTECFIWAMTWQNQQCGCAPSEDSDQPWHPPSLIRVFAVRMKKAWVLSYPLSGGMPRLIWVFAGHTVTLLVLSCRGSF